jgi:hypothetical protein
MFEPNAEYIEMGLLLSFLLPILMALLAYLEHVGMINIGLLPLLQEHGGMILGVWLGSGIALFLYDYYQD